MIDRSKDPFPGLAIYSTSGRARGKQVNLLCSFFFLLCRSLFSLLCLLMFAAEPTDEGTTQHKRNKEYRRLFAVGNWRRHGAVAPPPPSLHSNRPCIAIRGAREPSLSILQIYAEGWILRLSRAFARWPRWYYWCIAVHVRFLASKALHVPCIMQNLSVFRNFSDGLGRRSSRGTTRWNESFVHGL